MEYGDSYELGAELAHCEAALEGHELGSVRYYWSRLIAEELGAVESEVPPEAWSEMATSERIRLRRHERRTGKTTLRLISEDVSASNPSEAA